MDWAAAKCPRGVCDYSSAQKCLSEVLLGKALSVFRFAKGRQSFTQEVRLCISQGFQPRNLAKRSGVIHFFGRLPWGVLGQVCRSWGCLPNPPTKVHKYTQKLHLCLGSLSTIEAVSPNLLMYTLHFYDDQSHLKLKVQVECESECVYMYVRVIYWLKSRVLQVSFHCRPSDDKYMLSCELTVVDSNNMRQGDLCWAKEKYSWINCFF